MNFEYIVRNKQTKQEICTTDKAGAEAINKDNPLFETVVMKKNEPEPAKDRHYNGHRKDKRQFSTFLTQNESREVELSRGALEVLNGVDYITNKRLLLALIERCKINDEIMLD